MSAPRPPPDRDDLLERALARVASRPPPPPPPSVARVFARVDAGAATSNVHRVPLATAFAFGAAVAALGLAFLLRENGPAPTPRTDGFRVEWMAGNAAMPFARSGAPVPPSEERAGDELRATDASTFVFSNSAGRAAEVGVEREARLVVASGSRIDVIEGRASFRLLAAGHGTLGVTAGRVRIVDRGTTFGVDVGRVDPPAGLAGTGGAVERVLVTVIEGAVDAAGVEIRAGEGLAFVDGRPLGAPWALDARPSLSLETEGESWTAGEPVVLRLALSNSTDGWIPWPSSGGAGSPIHVEVTDPAGAVSLVRVTDAMLVGAAAAGRAIPPRGRDVLRVRFDRTFASPGTYRLRAIFRPAQAVESPTSNTVSLPVRAPGGPR